MELEEHKLKDLDSFISQLEEMSKLLREVLPNSRGQLNGEKYFSNNDLCELLHISKRTLQEYRDCGILPYIKLGGKILYKESDILKLLSDSYIMNMRL